MTLRRASLLLPGRRLDDFPTHLTGDRAAELLAAWTALWHPALIGATGALPGWHPADEPPDPAELEGELVVVPTVSRQRLPGDWFDRLRATEPRNPPPVEAAASREATIAATLASAGIHADQVAPDLVADFLALGHAHLQVELLTRAMHYSSVLDTEQFTGAVTTAAAAAVAGNAESASEELARAFDLLGDARNHVYSVDFYVIDLTLLAPMTLGETLRAKLAGGTPTSLLATGELLDCMAREHPESLAELRRAIEAGTACVAGGFLHGGAYNWAPPETVLRELKSGQRAAQQHLGRDYGIFAQFEAALSPILPEILAGTGFKAALHAAFDGSRLPRADQCKTWWGPGEPTASHERERAVIQALSTTPLDAARPETWLRLAASIGNTIARDHVATVLLAGWPGTACEYYDDLVRAARYGPLLGKLVTLEEYFRVSREPDEWTTFYPREYPIGGAAEVRTYRDDVLETYRRLCEGVAAVAGASRFSREAESAEPNAESAIGPNPRSAAPRRLGSASRLNDSETSSNERAGAPVVINPFSFSCSRAVFGIGQTAENDRSDVFLPNVPGCGYATVEAGAAPSPVALAEGHILRNERLELTVSETTGGIQSLRTHRDRSTRLSQRLVFHQGSTTSMGESRMVAEQIEITRNEPLVGEITSRGRLLDASGELAARFTQSVRMVRGLPAAIVDVQLEAERLAAGDSWSTYYASRIAWNDDALSVRRGMQWLARPASGSRIESPEWVEVDDGIGTVTCFAQGLPLHRRCGSNWLDTLLLTAGQQEGQFQFALGIDVAYPTQTALALLTVGRPCLATMPVAPASPTGWFLHVGAKNVLITHIEPLAARQSGVRVRLLETEGRDTRTTLAAYRPFKAARMTDFRGNELDVLSVADGRAELHLPAHRWIQIEAEW